MHASIAMQSTVQLTVGRSEQANNIPEPTFYSQFVAQWWSNDQAAPPFRVPKGVNALGVCGLVVPS
jgi:hypothetical protein